MTANHEVAAIYRGIWIASATLTAVPGLACCFHDPLHHFRERYVMTETISLFLRGGPTLFFPLPEASRIRHLAIAQGFSILLIGFRMATFCVVQ